MTLVDSPPEVERASHNGGTDTERLEQISVLLLLPVFFFVSSIKVDLRSVGLSGLGQLGLILLVAIVGKFVGAFIGARLPFVLSWHSVRFFDRRY